jgi:hypothetical protein
MNETVKMKEFKAERRGKRIFMFSRVFTTKGYGAPCSLHGRDTGNKDALQVWSLGKIKSCREETVTFC